MTAVELQGKQAAQVNNILLRVIAPPGFKKHSNKRSISTGPLQLPFHLLDSAPNAHYCAFSLI
jgi:hypothetical protein